MSTENLAAECKQRFKGVENFLRRVAFNLGNTPSQTEVKIISCIPIDVTDLQQKIALLEKQLEEPRARANGVSSNRRKSSVHTALCCSNYPHMSTVAVPSMGIDCACGKSNITMKCICSATNQIKSTPSLQYLDTSSNNQECHLCSTEVSNMTPEHVMLCNNSYRKNFFRKRKKAQKKNVNSQMVYYAQPHNKSPFNNYDTPESIPKDILLSDEKILSRSYISDVIQKQYNPGPIVKEYSNSSQFSSPVCRDARQSCKGIYSYGSDICSCCHGRFQNTDNYITQENYSDPIWSFTHNARYNRNSYYDSSLYDLVPVKEKPAKVKKDIESNKRELARKIDIKCWPENIRPKQRPFIVNYYTTTPGKPLPRRVPLKSQNKREVISNRSAAKKARKTKALHEPSTSCVEFGKVYPKRLYAHKSNQSQRISVSIQPIQNNNAECSKINANDTECQTTTVNTEPTPRENKTEVTLNQIKSILQSVLAEVKTNSILKNESEATTKKDAVVQKELSQSNLQGSSFIRSFTYSPYDMNSNIAACSKHLASGHLGYSGIPQAPVKCMPHYPLFVQHPGRHMYTNCFRNNSYVPKTPPTKLAASAATNTEAVPESSNTETDKLIKEIYKSMALTLGIPAKDTSTSECDDLKSAGHDHTNQFRPNTGKEKQTAASISSVFRNDLPDTSITCTQDTTYDSKLPTNEPSTRSHLVRTDEDISRETIKQYFQNRERRAETMDSGIDRERVTRDRGKQNAALAVSEEDTDTSSTETESDDTIAPVEEPVTKLQKTQKKGILCKMLKLFKPRERNTKKTVEVPNELEDELEASDSDDYQTVYSHDVAPKHNRRNLHKARPHSKIFNAKLLQHRGFAHHSERSPEKCRKVPYMEQEYRRQWDEKLSFHEGNMRHSSRQYSRDTPPLSRHPVYYRNYEAKSAMVEPARQFCRPPAAVKVRQGDVTTECKIQSKPKVTAKGLAWLKKHKLGIHCGEQWKNFILEG